MRSDEKPVAREAQQTVTRRILASCDARHVDAVALPRGEGGLRLFDKTRGNKPLELELTGPWL